MAAKVPLLNFEEIFCTTMRALIVQPWFTALGHPAQSVLNTARTLGPVSEVGYLVSAPRDGALADTARELERYGPVDRFRSAGDSLRAGTLLSLPSVLRAARENKQLHHVFYLDAHLVVLAAAWPLISLLTSHLTRVSLVYLAGPERIAGNSMARMLVQRFLSAPGRCLFLRTAELLESWRQAFPNLPSESMGILPSLETVAKFDHTFPSRVGGPLHFGVIGQVRPGKSLEWLVPMFSGAGTLGRLQIAGTFNNARDARRMDFLREFPGFDNRFLSEDELLAAGARQDYLLALYDDWDTRMEAATLYLAARVGRPVIVYGEGWPGRMIREYGCGVAISPKKPPDDSFFRGLPRPGDDQYRALVAGLDRFRMAHDSARNRELFLGKLMEVSG